MNQELNYGNGAFQLVSKEYIEELKAEAYLLAHKKTGAHLFYVAANDDNKVFSVSFRTPPKDSTGVAHILEHSVLCGSRKFPLKEPFVELVKGSLNTFLNAMTYPDKTVYPVASKNDKDFRNLMDVYLDAVFFPNVLHDPEIVMQEGWHYELNSLDDELTYKGVVYNEMKGVYSSPDALLDQNLMTTLFPDTTYGVDSGGNPDCIINLTFEGFVDFYKTYYHPSNSYIFLYGNMPLDEHLRFIDEEYLSHFDKAPIDSHIAMQETFSEGKEGAYAYNISSEESEKGKSLHSLAYVLPTASPKFSLAFEVLTHALIGSPAAPLKNLLVKEGVGTDVVGMFQDGILQPIWNIVATGSEKDKGALLQNLVEEFLRNECERGINKKSLEASLNSIEFILREADFQGRPIGLIYNLRVLDQWLYGGDPFEALHYEEALKELRQGLESDYYENLIKTYLLENNHKALVTMYPEKGLQERKEAAEKEKLAALKASLSEDELKAIVAETEKLLIRQSTPDTEEALSTIPLLELEDLEAKEYVPQAHVTFFEGSRLHHVDTFTNGIGYSNFYFKLHGIEEEDIPYIYLLSALMGRLDTKTYTYDEMDRFIHFYLGGFSSNVVTFNDMRKNGELAAYISLSVKALTLNIDKIWETLDEVLYTSDFFNEENLKNLIGEYKAVWDMSAFSKGNTLVSTRLLSRVSKGECFADKGNLAYYEFITNLAKLESLIDVSNRLKALSKKLFTKNNLDILFVGDEEQYTCFKDRGTPVIGSWPEGLIREQPLVLNGPTGNVGIVSAGQVQYVAKGGNFKDHGYEFHGSMRVLETILKYEYLWSRIRVQGGAYGAFATFRLTGEVVFCSYRDPNLVNTIKVYDEMADYIASLELSERELRKYIIGTMSALDMPTTPFLDGVKYMVYYFTGKNPQDFITIQEEVIATKVENLKKLSHLVRAIMNDNYLCAMGNEQKIKDAKEYFDEIVSLPN